MAATSVPSSPARLLSSSTRGTTYPSTGFAAASPYTTSLSATSRSIGAPVTSSATMAMPSTIVGSLGTSSFPATTTTVGSTSSFQATTVGSPMARTYTATPFNSPMACTSPTTFPAMTTGSPATFAPYTTTSANASFAAARPYTTSMGAPVTSLPSARGMPATTTVLGSGSFPATTFGSPRALTYPATSYPAMTTGFPVTSMFASPIGQAVAADAAPLEPVSAGLSLFENVEVAPPDAILSLASRFKEDKFPKKVNLGIGAYRTEEGKPWPLPSVLAAQMLVCEDPTEDKEYVPIDGKPEHKRPVQQLIFSDAAIDAETIATTQAISGTGSLQIIGQFLSNYMNCTVIHVPNPTWGNHNAIFKRAGVTAKNYTYYKPETRGFDFEGMMEALNDMPAGDAILLHACAQNPTGVDPTPDQWLAIVDMIRARGLIPVLDNAYQGYASGSLEKDGYSMRLFEDSGLEFFVAQSFAKNFGLYGERIGYIHVQTSAKQFAVAVLSQLKILIRQAYSSPPRHGAAIVNKVLTTPALKEQWLSELNFMSQRILQMRDALRSAIEGRSTPGTWNHVTDQIGMFSYTGLDTAQVERMVNEFHIYMTKDGRISVAGLNPGNVDYVAECLDIVVRA